jgi:hypothetical protein
VLSFIILVPPPQIPLLFGELSFLVLTNIPGRLRKGKCGYTTPIGTCNHAEIKKVKDIPVPGHGDHRVARG